MMSGAGAGAALAPAVVLGADKAADASNPDLTIAPWRDSSLLPSLLPVALLFRDLWTRPATVLGRFKAALPRPRGAEPGDPASGPGPPGGAGAGTAKDLGLATGGRTAEREAIFDFARN